MEINGLKISNNSSSGMYIAGCIMNGEVSVIVLLLINMMYRDRVIMPPVYENDR